MRSTLTQGRIARVLFCEHEGKMILLHAFIKKTQKTPPGDLDLAVRRKKRDHMKKIDKKKKGRIGSPSMIF